VCIVGFLGAGCSKQSKVAGYLKRGGEYVAKGEYLKGEIEYLNAMRLDPANLTAIRGLGDIYFEQGNTPKAFAFLKKAADSGVTDDDLRLKLARMYLTGRRMKEARDEASAVLQNKPDLNALVVLSQAAVASNEIHEVSAKLEAMRSRAENTPGFQIAVGTLAMRQQNLKLAEESFKRALAMDSKLSVVHEMMANLYFRQKNVAQGGQALKTAAELAPVRSLTPLRYVEYLKDSGDEAGALQKVEEILKKAPDYLPASVQLAQMHFAARRNDQAAEVVKRILAMDPANYEALLLNGRLQLARGESAKGMAELERLAIVYPRVPQVHYHLAIARLFNSDNAKALASLGQAVALDPDYADALLLQADLNLRRGDAGAVIRSMTELIREKPQLGRAYIILGDAYAMRKSYSEALDAYARLSKVLTNSPVPYHLTGELLTRIDRPVEARSAFQKALEKSPAYYPSVEQLVELDVRAGKAADAMSRVQAEIQQNPKSAPRLVLLAKVYLAATNNVQAEATLRKAIELEPDSTTAPALLARILTSTGRGAEALASLRQASAKNPNEIGVLMQIGMIEDALGNHAAARDAYEQLLKVKSEFGPALNNLAYLYSEHFNKLDRAYELARKARELSPKDPASGDTLGWILYKRGEYGWALGMLQQSGQALPNEPEVAYHLGMVQYMTGDEEGARASFTRATSIPKKYPGREDAGQRLQLLNVDFAKADASTLARMEKQLADNPGDPIVAGRLALLEEGKGNYDKAVSIYERAIAANKGNVAAMSRAARIYAERLKNPKKALELAKAAREASPEDPALAHTLGALAYTTGDQAWAVNLLEQSSRKLTEDADVLYDLALAQYSVGRISDSEATMQRAIDLGKAFPRLEAGKRWLTMSSLYKDTARLRQSAAVLGEWLKAEPSNPAVLMANGTLHELQTNSAAAEDSYARLLAVYPSFAPASLRLASIYAGRAETLPKAYEMASRLRQTQPNDAEVARLLGTISYRRADYVRAAQLLNESSRTFKSDPEVWYYLGLAHHQLKQKEEARRALGQLLTLESTGLMAAEARRLLAEIK
jgi:tetratricopeptide (TPR) repeat protein